MTLEQVDSLFGYWRGAPPTHELVAAYMGVKPEPTSEQGGVTISADEKAFVERMRAKVESRG